VKISIPGFPEEVSEPIELPDIGELLMYPYFQGITADDFLKHATDFQKYLLNQVPLRHDRKSVIVRCGVWLLRPGTRSHVNQQGDWHFDGESPFAHVFPDERIFVLSSPCSALTEFNLHPLEIESTPEETRDDVANRIREDPGAFGVVGRPIRPCCIYTFSNHLHRAVDPKRIEFRFFLRVRETDKPGSVRGPLKDVYLQNLDGVKERHIVYDRDKVSIYFPVFGK
jgi:hypothetical protein